MTSNFVALAPRAIGGGGHLCLPVDAGDVTVGKKRRGRDGEGEDGCESCDRGGRGPTSS
jgi:hypothetical protein